MKEYIQSDNDNLSIEYSLTIPKAKKETSIDKLLLFFMLL